MKEKSDVQPKTVKVDTVKRTGVPIYWDVKHRPDEQPIPNKARKLISSETDLPRWFSVNSYNKVAQLSLKELYDELCIRALYYSIADVFVGVDFFVNQPTERDFRARNNFFGSSSIPADEKIEIIRYADKKIENSILIGNEIFECNIDECSFDENLESFKKWLLKKYDGRIVDYSNKEVVFSGIVGKCDDNIIVDKLDKTFSTLDIKAKYKGFDVELLTPDECLYERFTKCFESNEEIRNFKSWLKSEREKLIIQVEGTRTPLLKHVITERNYKIEKFDQKKNS